MNRLRACFINNPNPMHPHEYETHSPCRLCRSHRDRPHGICRPGILEIAAAEKGVEILLRTGPCLL
jgi:hypothetical protein